MRPPYCWFCHRRLRWGIYRVEIEPNKHVLACARCTKLKRNMTLQEWLIALQDETQWPKWNDGTRETAILKVQRYLARTGDGNEQK